MDTYDAECAERAQVVQIPLSSHVFGGYALPVVGSNNDELFGLRPQFLHLPHVARGSCTFVCAVELADFFWDSCITTVSRACMYESTSCSDVAVWPRGHALLPGPDISISFDARRFGFSRRSRLASVVVCPFGV